MPANFNLAEHAAYFTKAGNLIDATSYSADNSKARKLAIVIVLFAPYSVYDVKHGTVYQGDEVAGNYIFGYLGSALGYSQTDLVTLGAVAQQYQNLINSKAAASQQFTDFYEGMKQAIGPNPESADNPGDSQKIVNGQLAQQSGCNTSSQSNTSVTGGGGGGNWGSSGTFIRVGNMCFGYCYGTPRVTITDLP